MAFLCPAERLTPDLLSGMPARMLALLERRFERVTVVGPDHFVSPASKLMNAAPSIMFPFWPAGRRYAHRALAWTRDMLMGAFPGVAERGTLASAARASESVQQRLDVGEYDAIFGCCVSTVLYRVSTHLPVVYFSDATPHIINTTYPWSARRGKGYGRACDHLERTAYSKCARVIFASDHALHSAIEEYGLDPERGDVAPMGANVVRDEDVYIPHDAPPARIVRLCIAAADPRRKRLDFAIDTAEILAQRGWDCELTHIGPPTRRSSKSPVVRSAGRLRLSNPDHRREHKRILASSHLMILPSVGEAFGIAVCEAAHFGRPSIVSAAGGLPTAVRHEQTGLVMPMEATPSDYADAIESLLRSPERYRAMCEAAHDRAVRELNWDAWADRVSQAIVESVQLSPRVRKSSYTGSTTHR